MVYIVTTICSCYWWQVLEAYQAGIKSLKDVAIDIDKVDETLDQLAEVRAKINILIMLPP